MTSGGNLGGGGGGVRRNISYKTQPNIDIH